MTSRVGGVLPLALPCSPPSPLSPFHPHISLFLNKPSTWATCGVIRTDLHCHDSWYGDYDGVSNTTILPFCLVMCGGTPNNFTTTSISTTISITAALAVQHSPGTVCPRLSAPEEVVLQECEQRRGSAATLH